EASARIRFSAGWIGTSNSMPTLAAHACRRGPEAHGVTPFCYPAAGGCATTVGRNPYRGAAKPHPPPRPPAPPIIGIPGMPGVPGVPATSSTPGGLYHPSAGDAVAAWLAAGV